MATGDLHKKFVKIDSAVSEICSRTVIGKILWTMCLKYFSKY